MWFCCSIADGKRTCTPHRCTVSFRISSFLLSFGLFFAEDKVMNHFIPNVLKNPHFRWIAFSVLFVFFWNIKAYPFKNKRFSQIQWDKFRIWMLLQLRLIVKVFGNTFVMNTQKSFFLCRFKQINRDVHFAHKNANSSKCIHLSRNYLTILLRIQSFLHTIQCI